MKKRSRQTVDNEEKVKIKTSFVKKKMKSTIRLKVEKIDSQTFFVWFGFGSHFVFVFFILFSSSTKQTNQKDKMNSGDQDQGIQQLLRFAFCSLFFNADPI